MSELKLLEFRERAVHGVDVPDFADLERRGRGLRRRRYAAGVGAIALVLAAGGGLATVMGDSSPDSAPPPASSPSQSPPTEADVRTRPNAGESVLMTGVSTARYDGFSVEFSVPAPRWEWWGVGMGKRWSSDPNEYTGAIFFLADPVARQQPCRALKVRSLGNDPSALIDNVQPLLGMMGTKVLQPPRVVDAFGGTAVHLRVESIGLCEDDSGLPGQLGGNYRGQVAPGFGGRTPIDLWHVLIPGDEATSVLVASWDLGASEKERREQRGLLGSIRIRAD